LKGGEKMNNMISMMNLMSTNSVSKSNNSSVKQSDKNDDFISSLERNINNNSNKVSDKDSNKSSEPSNVSDKSEEDNKVKLDQKDIEKLEEVVKKDPEELSQEDIEGAMVALANIIDKLSEFKLSADGTKGEELALNQSLKGLIKGLKEFKSKLMKFDLKDSKLFAKDELKELLTKLKGKFVNSEGSEKHRIIHHRAINQGNIAKLSRDNQNKVERNIDIKGKDLVVEDNKKIIKSEQVFAEKLKDSTVNTSNRGNTEQQGSKEVDFSSVKNFAVNNSQNLETTNPNKVVVGNKEITFKNISNQIQNQVDVSSNTKGKDISIELRPEALGRLHLKVTVKDGVVSAKILAENGQVKELLEGNLAKLKQSLGQKNLQVENFDVSTGHNGEELAQSFSENRQFGFSQNNRKQGGSGFSLDVEELADEEFIVEEVKEEAGVIENDDVDYIA